MQSRALELAVGFFVCLGIAAIFILTMRVSNVSGIGGTPGYQLTAKFFNVGSLEAGAQVNMAGVRIGRVTSIQLDPQTYEAVVDMHIQKQYKLPEGSSASILTTGLLGNQYVGVTPGGSLKYMQPGESFDITQGAIILEQLISQFMYNMAKGNDDSESNHKQKSDSGSSGTKPLFPPKAQ